MVLYISFSIDTVKIDFPEYLKKNSLHVRHKGRVVHNCKEPQPGMALKHSSGVTMRIMAREKTLEKTYKYALAAVGIIDKHLDLFRNEENQ